jgi:hypothetical protein
VTREELAKRSIMIRAINDQMDRYEQEKGLPSLTRYNGEFIPRGHRNEDFLKNIITPLVIDEFKDNPEEYINGSEIYLEQNPGKNLYAPEVRDPKKIEDILFPKRMG